MEVWLAGGCKGNGDGHQGAKGEQDLHAAAAELLSRTGDGQAHLNTAAFILT